MQTSDSPATSQKTSFLFSGKVLLNTLIFCAVCVWFGTFARFGFDAHHDGIMLGAADAVAQGKLLFKEVFCQYGPLGVWIQSIPVLLFGAEDIVIKYTTVLFYGGIALLGASVWDRFLAPKFRWLWYACFLMLCPFYIVPFHPWSSVYALFFMLLGTELQLRFLEGGKGQLLFWSGVCAGAAFLCRTPCGLVSFGAGAAILLLRGVCVPGPRSFAPLIPYAGGTAAAGGLFALYLTFAGAWEDYFRQCFTFIFRFVVKRGGSWSWTQFSDSMFPLTGASGWTNCIFAILPLLVIGAVLLAVRPLFYGKKEAFAAKLPLLAVLLLALGSWHQYFPVPCVRHLYWAAIPAFGCYALTVQGICRMKRPPLTRGILLLFLALPLLYCFLFRAEVIVKYFEKLPLRVTGTAPSIRHLWIFPGEQAVFTGLHNAFMSLPPEIRRRGVLNHTPDGIYSCLLPPPAGFRHPMFVNWGDQVYPDYGAAVEALIKKERPCVLSAELPALPGYTILTGFRYFDKEYRFFVPEEALRP